jgi:hypothetical protein
MKAMKKMMEGMMPVMMKGVSSEERQEMMLKMMPMMMKDIDMSEMMPKMMAEMIPVILPEMLERMGKEGGDEKRLDCMAKMMPTICEVIDKEALAEKKDAVVEKLMERETFRERMPRCFAKGMPVMVRGCFEHFFPRLTKDERKEFIATLIKHMLDNGTEDFTEEEKQALFPDKPRS